LLGFLRPNGGRVRVLGAADPSRVAGRVGYLPERLRYHLRYTGREYLRYLGQFSDMAGPALESRVEEQLHRVGLLDAGDRMLGTYSRGMLQRLGVAQALLHEPALLLFDEPTSGLDPAGQREMLDLLAAMRGSSHTILMTTHYLDEAEQLCDRVGVLFDGRLAAESDAEQLRAPGRSVQIAVAGLTTELAAHLRQIAPAVRCGEASVTINPNTPAIQAAVVRALLDAGVPIISLEPRGRPLEELYMRAIQETPGEEQASPPQPAAPRSVRRRGDTLLRELLRREDERGEGSDTP
ncbi:MAG: hypothetical protein RLZZ387_4543, partial [Chloroflexota bacterium]